MAVILGVNAYHGDASAALVVDGQLVAAAEEERFARVKHIAGFPHQAIAYCLKAAGITPREITHIAISRNPRARLHRKLWAALTHRPRLDRIGDRVKNAIRLRDVKATLAHGLGVDPRDLRAEVHYVEHHRAHLASAFFVSGFDEAALLSVDGMGDFVSTMWGIGRGSRMRIMGVVPFPHSLGILYTAVTQYLGFPHYGDEYKVMGLSAYGEPTYLDFFRQIVRVDGDLGFRLDLSHFIHHVEGVSMTWDEGAPVLGPLYSSKLVHALGPPREPGAPIEPRQEQIAASLQAVLEEVMLALLVRLYERTRVKAVCLAGGVALNCVVNGKILQQTPFERVYIQPAASDAGTSIGAAFFVWHEHLKRPRAFTMEHAYWGPEWSESEIRETLHRYDLPARRLSSEEMVQTVARALAEGKIVGLFQGRMEFGPRALGNRSILADPRRPEMKDLLNRRVKNREPFRPFAPSIVEEAVGEYFEQTHPSPFMLMAYPARPEKRALIPAALHVDGTGRVQTVSRAVNPLFWEILVRFGSLTGVPVLINTSFNENEPIVCHPEEAIRCFQRTQMDLLAIGPYLVVKEDGDVVLEG
ncbi:MAG: carbamoyltransferase [Blastocatellia bacterium]|nr:carbamoyltransferase [Blastocatellia bacterium]MCS7156508.1 carbamoyltransferase [Blastocatellia bacterium]MCX7751751.1 carbamoyltransferase [Blastocatellia bacterium]MDW8168852.1 carbamoyltransferase C-terminal domain-containing protein [Acidobacteriota bacterium]MDW8256613.1 carbamoyltransferase C-terminal domain-containing protein [Acidobacteriota bacterium]